MKQTKREKGKPTCPICKNAARPIEHAESGSWQCTECDHIAPAYFWLAYAVKERDAWRQTTEDAAGAARNRAKERDLWRFRCFQLWVLLDNVDTLDDVCKEQIRDYQERVRQQVLKRFKVMEEPEVESLYNDHYPENAGLIWDPTKEGDDG